MTVVLMVVGFVFWENFKLIYLYSLCCFLYNTHFHFSYNLVTITCVIIEYPDSPLKFKLHDDRNCCHIASYIYTIAVQSILVFMCRVKNTGGNLEFGPQSHFCLTSIGDLGPATSHNWTAVSSSVK